jgi:predicted lipoprotein with Yx(FWY)xxD motif
MRVETLRFRGLAAAALVAFAGVVGFLLAGTAANGATHSNGTVSLHSTKLGSVLVNSHGRTLYLFLKDKNGHSSCTGQCVKFWPPLISATKPTAGTGVKASLLGWTKRSDGKMQVTYNKHPLYTFANDKASGQVTGENVSAFGGEWYVLNAKGAKVEPGQSTGTPTPTTTSSYTPPPPPGY